MPNLDLVPTEGLLQALKRRFDHMVFAGSKNMGGGPGRGLPRALHGSLLRHAQLVANFDAAAGERVGGTTAVRR
jgi:hypothetical protein